MPDYIVVGGGSAGAVLAARLSENPATSVMLLEAGPSSNVDEVKMPAAFYTTWRTKWDWGYSSVPQTQLHGRRTSWPRMKALGGCSSMNAMIYIRAHRRDYDEWDQRYGATGWSYDDVLPYFKRSEANSRASLSPEFHSFDGPLSVEDRRSTDPLTRAWVEAAVASGMPANDDFNGAELAGAGLYQVTCRRGFRASTEAAYLKPAQHRSNLTIVTGALVTAVDVVDGRAVGVTYRHKGEVLNVRADAEVILSGGAVNTPQLLMLSGIGPADHLREHDIPVVSDLAGVGGGLQDHPVVPLVWRTEGILDLMDRFTPRNTVLALLAGRGPLSSNAAEAGAFWSSMPDSSDPDEAAPDLQAVFAPTAYYDNVARDSDARMVTSCTTVVRVHSTGTVRLASNNPTWKPLIDPAYYTDERDMRAMISGLRTQLDIAHQRPFSQYLGELFLPRELGDDPSDEALVAHIRGTTNTLYHPVGTCAMGSGPDAVVDEELRVQGVEGLRVVDASVMPRVPRGNTNAPTIMIAERAADLIRGGAASLRNDAAAGRPVEIGV